MERKHCTEFVIVVFMTVITRCVLSDTCDGLVGDCSCQLKGDSGNAIGTFDVSSLDKQKHSHTPLFNQVKAPGSDTSKYSYNPCTSINVGSTTCTNVAACQLHGTSTYNLGAQDSVKYSVPQPGTVVLTYRAETSPPRSAVVSYICDCDAESPQLQMLGEETTGIYDFKVTSMHACVPACPPKEALSTGGILCIIFFVLVFTYFVGGVLINKFVLKRENGRDLIPNVDFWSDLPYLIKDGFLFAISPCRKQDAYDQI